MPQPTQEDLHVDAALTNISVAYIQDQSHFIASQVFARVPVDKQTDFYWSYDKDDWFRDEAKPRADNTESAGSGYDVSSTNTYACTVEAIHKDIGRQARANADAVFNMETDATRFVTQRLLVRREVQWVTDYFSTAIWGTDFNSTAAWSDYTNGDPILEIEAGKQGILQVTGFEANTLVLGYPTWRALKHHPDIIERIKYTGGPDSDVKKALADLFEIERILVAKSVINSANEAAAGSYAFNHGGQALLAYVNPNPSLLAPSAGYEFVWQGISDGMGEDIGITRIPLPKTRALRIEGEIAKDFKVVGADLGYFFSNASTF